MDLNHILFGVYPYVALSVLVIGSVAALRPRAIHLAHRLLPAAAPAPAGHGLGAVPPVGVLAIFAGHFVGLLTPICRVRRPGCAAHGFKQMLAVVAGGGAGLLVPRQAAPCCYCTAACSTRASAPPRPSATRAILILLIAPAMLLGLATIPQSLKQHRDGHEMLKFMTWAQGIFTLRPGSRRSAGRRPLGVQDPHRARPDHPARLPVHPPGPHAVGAGLVPQPPRAGSWSAPAGALPARRASPPAVREAGHERRFATSSPTACRSPKA
jgi:nitrate reductase gamma subunit